MTIQTQSAPYWLTSPPQTVLPSYPYVQYADDENISAFFTAYNEISQTNLTNLNNLYLPVYTSNSIIGPLLDWVGNNLYGIPRPIIPAGSATITGGLYDTDPYDTQPYDEGRIASSGSTATIANDDVYKRVLTWNLYRGDGTQFNVTWLKRRVLRFLGGVNGVDFPIDNTYQISVAFSTPNTVTIHINTGTIPTTYASVISDFVNSQVIQLPFQYNWSVTY